MASTVRADYYNDFFTTMLQNQSCGRFCDVEIQVGEEVFNCHRHILSLASNYFDGMFGGNFCESSSQKVVLRELDVGVFKVMLNFIYTGEAEISCSNLDDIIRASDFYQLPHLAEHCRIYIQENLNALAEQIWNIFVYARQSVRIEPISRLLKRHIRENFGYFSNAPEFVKLNVGILLEILGVGAEDCNPLPQDVFFEGIYTWIRHNQENLNPDQKKSYSDRLCNEIDFTQLSAEYTRDSLPKRKAVLASLSENKGGSIDAPDGVVQNCPKLLRAYVSISSEDQRSSVGTMTFSGFSNCGSWMYSGKVVNCFSEYMENVVIGDRLYSLGYSSGPHGEDPEQTFRCSNSFSMYPYTTLSLPAFVTNACDMCGTANEIYLYKKRKNRHDREREQHHLYFYKRDIDRWFPLPSPKVNVSHASMTYDEGRLYLVGGNSISKLIQAYDVRTREWTMLPPTMEDYWSPECCIYGKEICILDKRQSFGEMYDPMSGKSRPLTSIFNNQLPFCPYLENCTDIFLQNGFTCDHTISRFYMTSDQHGRILLPNLSDAVARVEGIPRNVDHLMLDLFTF